ncbi:MAG: hypothetical protein LC789_09125 [Actinobacteria bacterium]|nr:hypothetical protein [Actinomycetota bacterium]
MTTPDDPRGDPATAPAQPMQPEPVQPEPVEPESQPEPLEPEPLEPEPLEPEPLEPEPLQPEPLQPEPLEPEPLEPEPLEPEPLQPELVQPELVQPELVQPELVQPAVVPAPSLSDRLAQLEPDDDGPLFDEDPYDDAAYAEQPYADEPVPEPHAEPPYVEPVLEPVLAPAAVPVAAEAPPAEPAPPGAPLTDPTPRRQRSARRRISVPVLALLLMTALMAAATTYLWLQVREHDRTEQARRTGLEASRDAARLLFSYDYRTLDKDFSTGRELTTGEFRKQYDKTTTKVVSDVAKQYKAVVQADVVNAGVVRASPDQVVTIVYVNQVTTSTRVTGEKVDLSRVKMTLAKVGNRWLVTAVNAL